MAKATDLAADTEQAVRDRYSRAAFEVEAALCCPTCYDPKLLAAIPEEVIRCDYGCGDPTRYLHAGERVLDLGCGAGKACFLAAQAVGAAGCVIGVDMNARMLDIARRAAPEVAKRIGYANVQFRRGKIQDLALDLDSLDEWLSEHPVSTSDELTGMEDNLARLRASNPLVAGNSVDVVVSNCVLNLVRNSEKPKLFSEIHRVLRRGGRAIISDIVSDEDVPVRLQADPDLWSGCISGALREDLFLQAFEDAGLYAITVLERQQQPWRTVEGIEFRSMTVAAYKGEEGACWERNQAVIYRGPFRQVQDDDGHTLHRGVRTAVCDKTFQIYSREPYNAHFELVPPRIDVPLEDATPFPCSAGVRLRDPKETKGQDYRVTSDAPASCCAPTNGNGSCC